MIMYFKIRERRAADKYVNAAFQKIFPELMSKEKIFTAILDIKSRKLTVKTSVEGGPNIGIKKQIVDMFSKCNLYVTLDMYKTRQKGKSESENNKWTRLLIKSEHLHLIK